MADEGAEDLGSNVECIFNMFGGLLSKDAIITIVESCGGDIHLAVDAVMKITNDTLTPEANAESEKTAQNEASAPTRGECQVATPQSENACHNVPQQSSPMAQPNVVQQQQFQLVNQLPISSYSRAIAQQPNQAKGNQPSPAKVNQPKPANPSPVHRGQGAVPKVRTIPINIEKSQWDDQIKRIIEYHNHGSRTLILMRGVPGSGKTQLAEKIVEMLIGGTFLNFRTHICSTDDYFMNRGHYNYVRADLSNAHSWNQRRTRDALRQGLSPVIVDNTNIDIWEMEFYARYGVENGYIIEVVEPNTAWAKKASQLAKKNVHNVPLSTIKRMLDNYVDDISGENVREYFLLKYPPDKTPPVLRSMPVFQPLKEAVLDTKSETAITTSQPVMVVDIPNRDDSLNYQVSQIKQETSGPVHSPSHVETAKENEADIVNISEGSLNIKETTSENNEHYLELQKQLDEIEKVEREWENGESWEEVQPEPLINSKIDEGKMPKPPRAVSPQPLPATADQNLSNVVQICNDWREISLYMPPWKDEIAQPQSSVETSVEKISSCTFMSPDDFDVSKTNHKIISATPRNINEFHISFQREKIPDKRMLDKSTTTNELVLTNLSRRCKNEESHFCAFRKLFKNISRVDLRDIFDHCMGDVNWAVEIVLDGMAANQFDIINEEDEEEEEIINQEQCTCLASYNIVPDTSAEQEAIPEKENEITKATESMSIVPKKSSKRESNRSDASLQLKKHIEQNVFIADNHYSKHCLKVKRWRHGIQNPADEEVGEIQDENQPSTSKGAQVVGNVSENTETSDSGDTTDDEESSEAIDDPEKTINITLGKEFISELDELFGRSDMSYPENLKLKINIPVSLLNAINALWIESMMHQLDEQERQAAKMIQQDAEFARQVAMKEAELAVVGKQPEVLDFKEIMDMDLALSLYQRDVAEWKNKEPNDLAAKLTREKLYNLFPDVEKEVLAELLMAHDNNFQATVEVLLVSTGKGDLLNEDNGINNFVTEKEMERQKKVLEEEKKALSEVEWPLLPSDEVPDMDVVNHYRDEAGRHLKSRDMNIQKASDYVRRGMLTVGSYYRQLAEFHKLKYEQSNSLAAASLIQLHASKSQDSATIDLHYLRVAEAKESLDLFIDTHIQKLKSLQSQGGFRQHTLYFITGRGLHSLGKPRVKPAVKRRLRERGLLCSEMNPGLLSTKITADDKLTHQIA